MTDPTTSLRRARARMAPPEPAFDRLLDRRHRNHRSARITSIAMAFVVVSGGVAGAVVALGHTGPARHGIAAGGGGAGQNLVAGPGQYYYWKFVRVIPDQPKSQTLTDGLRGGYVHEQMWWGPDGSGRYEAHSNTDGYAVPAGSTFSKGDFPGVAAFETDVSGLSSDPNVLNDQLLGRSGSNGASPQPQVTLGPGVSQDTSDLWRAAMRLFEQATAEPATRAALYDVLAARPEVRQASNVNDPVGRRAISLSLPMGDYYGGGTDTLYFDPGTHLLMDWVDAQSGQTLVVEEGGIVDSRSDTPKPGDAFFPATQNPPPSP